VTDLEANERPRAQSRPLIALARRGIAESATAAREFPLRPGRLPKNPRQHAIKKAFGAAEISGSPELRPDPRIRYYQKR
jgi:hypothetical protein